MTPPLLNAGAGLLIERRVNDVWLHTCLAERLCVESCTYGNASPSLEELAVIATMHNGPYDGLQLDHNDVNLYTRIQLVGNRTFVLMPPMAAWDAVRRDELSKDGPFDGALLIYEFIRTPLGVEGRYDPDGKVFVAALEQYRAGEQPVSQVESEGQYYKCCRGDLRDVSLPDGHFTVEDEKGREWLCAAVSKSESEEGGFAEMVSQLGGEPSDQPLRLVAMSCEDKDELRYRLSDLID